MNKKSVEELCHVQILIFKTFFVGVLDQQRRKPSMTSNTLMMNHPVDLKHVV